MSCRVPAGRSVDNHAPLPHLRVTVRRAMPNFAANALDERPKVEATRSNIAAGNPLRTWVRISREELFSQQKCEVHKITFDKWLITKEHGHLHRRVDDGNQRRSAFLFSRICLAETRVCVARFLMRTCRSHASIDGREARRSSSARKNSCID